MTHEDGFVENFVVPEKKERLSGFFKKDKNRWKALLEIEHFSDLIFDVRFAEQCLSGEWSPEEVIRKLKSAGAPSNCYIISNSDMDQMEMTLDTAIQEVVGIGLGTLVSCIPGQLAYFEGELGDQVILKRKLKG
jgi:hypothetical protein